MGQIEIVKAHSWRSGIFTQEFEPMDHDIGMAVYEEPQNDKPTIHLFAIDKAEEGTQFKHAAYNICQGIMDDHFDGQSVTDFNWKYSASGGLSDVEFHEQHGHITGVTFSNDFAVTNRFFIDKVEEYERALADPDNFANILSDGHPERYMSGRSSRVIVPVPLHPAGHITMDPTYMNTLEDTERKIILLDTNKLWDQLIDQTKQRHGLKTMEDMERYYNDQPMKGDDSAYAPFHCDVADALEHIKPQNDYPGETAVGSFWQRQEPPEQANGFMDRLLRSVWKDKAEAQEPSKEVAFVNGRHRTLNMMKLGAPYVPISVDKCDNSAEMEAQLGWNGNTEISLSPRDEAALGV